MKKTLLGAILAILSYPMLIAQPAESMPVPQELSADIAVTVNNYSVSPERRARELVSQMTLWEKCMLISGKKDGFKTFSIERLGIPEVRMADGPQGVRNDTRSTYYPCGISLASTWNPDLALEMGRGLGLDCKARGVGILLAPGVNIYRSALCGRNFEYFGEDPFLASEIACSYIKGLQNEGVIATIKHFVANNQENLRHRTNSVVDERTLNEIYYPVFRNAVQKAGVGAVMMSYNPVNGIHASENKHLIEDVLRKEWGFDGIVMSDWLSTYTTLGCVESGLDIEMPKGNFLNYDSVVQLINMGVIKEEQIDKKCVNILRTFIRFGFLDGQEVVEPTLPLDNQECCDIAYEVAKEGPVMLKNSGLLPLNPKKTERIFVVGPNSDFIPFGGGSGEVFHIEGRGTTVYSGLTQISRKWEVVHIQPTDSGQYDLSEVGKNDVVVACVGYDKSTEREGFDRSYSLPDGQDDLIKDLSGRSDRVIVVVNSGGEVDVPWLDEVEALLMSWYPGQEGGRVMADIIIGRISPSGRLPFTFWGSEKKNPSYDHYGTRYNEIYPPWRDTLAHTVYYEGVFLGYRGQSEERKPMFPFGFGLTYTTFNYSDMRVKSCNDGFEVSFSVENTGKHAASEVVQLYVKPKVQSLPRPEKELKGFVKVALQPGEIRNLSIVVSREDFSFYDLSSGRFVVSSGEYELILAPDALDCKLSETVIVK